MSRANTAGRLERLEIIKARLQSDAPTTIGDIAQEIGVSVRTLARDIHLLREQGLPIEADPGRGGGIRLVSTWGVGKVNFNYAEAVDLLVSLAVAEKANSPFFLAHLQSVRNKLLASFPPRLRAKTRGLKARILVSDRASLNVLPSFKAPKTSIVEQVHEAFMLRKALRISYRAMNGKKSNRVIEPQFLLWSMPIWYILAFDRLKSSPRTFRCDRIERASILDEQFAGLPISNFQETLEGIDIA